MKKLINDVHDVVPQMLAGLVMSNPGLALLDGHDVVLRADVPSIIARGEVALISGGGAGHEPAHAGYIGPGLLTAAVSGDVFTSPSVDAVLAAILAVGGPGGVLLIVKNYTGDRLNFGLAAEIARARGLAVEMVVVADDVALAADGDHAGRRGIAGTVWVHKVAGAAAANGLTLREVRQAAEAAMSAIGTMGVALAPCTVPAAGRPGFELAADEVELGLGIHGEPGVRRAAMASADVLVGVLADAIANDLALRPGEDVAMLVNNLGGTPTMELHIATRAALAWAAQSGLRVQRIWSGSFLTALEMAGVSLSLMRLDQALLAALDAPAAAPGWPSTPYGNAPTAPVVMAATGPAGLTEEPGTGGFDAPRTSLPAPPPHVHPIAHPTARALRRIFGALHAAEDELTRLDQAVGDGDLGASLSRGARAIQSELQSLPLDDLPALLRAMAATVRRTVGGTSGPLYAIALMRAALAFELQHPNHTHQWAAALRAAADGIASIGGAQVGDRTMLDALVPAAQAFEAAAMDGQLLTTALRRSVEAAHLGAEQTARLMPRRGRSSYLGERALGHADPGARAVTVWLGALGDVDG